MVTKESTLVSLAMLKVKINKGSDYLEYLEPFILYILRTNSYPKITDDIISDAILRKH